MAHITIPAGATTIEYAVGASRSVFPVPFPYFAATDLVVVVGGDTDNPLVLNADYSVSGTAVEGGFSGGEVTLDVAVSSTTVVIERVLPIERTTDFPNSGPLSVTALNTQIDKIVAIQQQLDDGLTAVVETVDSAIAQLADTLNAETDGTFYSSRAAAEAATIVVGTAMIYCAGHTSAGDHGGGFYQETSILPTHDLYFAKDARYYEFVGWRAPGDLTVTPEMFGSLGTYATDQPALIAMALWTEDIGGKGVRWKGKPGKTYKVWHTITTGSQNFLMSSSDQTGLVVEDLKIEFAQSAFESDFDYATAAGGSCLFMHFKNARNIDIDGITFTCTTALVNTITDGVTLLIFNDNCRGVRAGYIRQVGGGGCVSIGKSAGFSNQERARDFEFSMLDLKDVYYGINAQRNGDWVRATIRTENAGRAYFPISVSHHDVEIFLAESRDVAQTVYLVLACAPAGENKFTDIRVRISGIVHGNCVQMQINQDDAGSPQAGVFHDVSVHFARLNSATGVTGGNIVAFGKGTVAPLGHSVENVVISGVLQNIDTDATIAAMFTDSDWTGEFIENVGFRDMVVSGGGAFNIDGRGIDKNLFFENIDARNNALNLTNIPQGVLHIGDGVGFTKHKTVGTVSGRGFYRHLPGGRVLQYGKTTCTSGNATTDQTLPVPFRSGSGSDNFVLGHNNYSGGTPGFSVTIPDSVKVTISRSDTTGDKDCGWSVEGYSNATGSPEP